LCIHSALFNYVKLKLNQNFQSLIKYKWCEKAKFIGMYYNMRIIWNNYYVLWICTKKRRNFRGNVIILILGKSHMVGIWRLYECFEHLAKRIIKLRFPFVIDPFHTRYIATSRYIYDRGCRSIDMVTSSILLKPDTLVHWTERSLKNPAIIDIPTVGSRVR